MALTRKMLATMDIDADKIDQIIDAHTETVDGLKKQVDDFKKQAERVPSLEKQVEELKAEQPTEDWESKYSELKKEYEEYQKKVEAEQSEQEKARLFKTLLKECGVDEKRIDSIIKVTNLSRIEVKDGSIVDEDKVKEGITEEWADFIVQTKTQGADVDEPPTNTGGKMTKDEIMKIKDTRERQQAIADNFEQFQ